MGVIENDRKRISTQSKWQNAVTTSNIRRSNRLWKHSCILNTHIKKKCDAFRCFALRLLASPCHEVWCIVPTIAHTRWPVGTLRGEQMFMFIIHNRIFIGLCRSFSLRSAHTPMRYETFFKCQTTVKPFHQSNVCVYVNWVKSTVVIAAKLNNYNWWCMTRVRQKNSLDDIFFSSSSSRDKGLVIRKCWKFLCQQWQEIFFFFRVIALSKLFDWIFFFWVQHFWNTMHQLQKGRHNYNGNSISKQWYMMSTSIRIWIYDDLIQQNWWPWQWDFDWDLVWKIRIKLIQCVMC